MAYGFADREQSGEGLGACLKQWRGLRRYKQSHVAELLDVSQGTVSRWENSIQLPNESERTKLLSLLSARLSSPADHQLARLVRHSHLPVHLICDLSHRLLAASEQRVRQFQIDPGDLIGASLWPAATPEICAAENTLAERGWFAGADIVFEGTTRAKTGPLIRIPKSRFRWTRFRISDGTSVRLVETLSDY